MGEKFAEMIVIRKLTENEISRELFTDFKRRQIVTNCWRKIDGVWQIKDDPFIDDWDSENYDFLVRCLKNTVRTGGLVCGAFSYKRLKGFVSVESAKFGSRNQYMDMSSLHVSADMRRHGIGAMLFCEAANFALECGAEKLYISSHSAVETQAFYKNMGCKDALEINASHVEKEPFDVQLELKISEIKKGKLI